MRLRTVKNLVEAQGVTVLRANAYMAYDPEGEAGDPVWRTAKQEYRNRIHREGFHLMLKEVQRYVGTDGQEVVKANADLDLAVDAMLQEDNLDYVLLGTGDGDFLRLVRALQSRGKRVDLLSFANTSGALRREVDYHFSGFLVPGILPPTQDDQNRQRGIMHGVNEERGFGFLTLQTGLGIDEFRDDIFLHINDFAGPTGVPLSNEGFARLKTRGCIIEFELTEQADGRPRARLAWEFVPPR
jgi:cold shock CspA family protein